MQVKVVVFEVLKELYAVDPFFHEIGEECSKGPFNQFPLLDGFLFKDNQLCIPECSLRQAIIKETHEGLSGHLDEIKR